MAVNDFYPFRPNQKVTVEQWNELFDEIRSGYFFLDDTPISGMIYTLNQRVTAIELRMDTLEAFRNRNWQKHQEPLIAGQTQVTLAHPPVLDSEFVHLNGICLSKTQVDYGFVGDYTLDGAVITLHPDVAIEVLEGDVLNVCYQYVEE